MAGNISSTILLPELVAKTPKEYEELAIKLALNSEKMRSVGDKLALNRSIALLFNSELFARKIELSYREVYRSHYATLQSKHIYIFYPFDFFDCHRFSRVAHYSLMLAEAGILLVSLVN